MKGKYVFALFLAFLFYLSNGYCQINLTQGLVAYYPFNGDATDQSGNGNNATFNNATLTTDRFGNANSAYYFNGVDNYIQIPNSTSLNPTTISLCAIVKPMGFYYGTCHGNAVITKGNDANTASLYRIRFDDYPYTNQQNCANPQIDSLHQNFYADFGGNGFLLGPYTPYVEKENWFCIVFTYDGINANFYINGILQYSEASNIPFIPSSDDLFFGKHNSTLFPYWFNGVIDEVRIYNRAINQQEISTLCVLCNQPQGSLSGSSICSGANGMLTYNSTVGTAPFTIQYSDGTNTYTQNNIADAIPFAVQSNPTSTTTYNLLSVTDATGCSRNVGFVSGVTQIVVTSCNTVTASFTAPDSVCVNAAVNVVNNSVGASTYYWSFCAADFNSTPEAVNIGNPGNLLNSPVFASYNLDDNGNYYGLVVNHITGELIRLNFGNSLLNSPTAEDLGEFNGVIPAQAESIQVLKINGNWTAIIVGGGNQFANSSPRIIKLDFGNSLANTPTATNWGNVGGLNLPHDLFIAQEGGNYYGFTINVTDNTITRLSFGPDFSNPPTGVNLGNIGNLNYPAGFTFVKYNGNWFCFIANRLTNSLTRLDFGVSLLNNPTGTDIGNPGGYLNYPRDISLFTVCDGVYGFVVNEQTNEIVKLNFGTDPTSIPQAVDLGNIGDFSFPHSISDFFRSGNDIYAFIPNVNNNTLTRIRFAGCQDIPGSTLQNPASFSYSKPGTYNINLLVDLGLPTQTSFCKQIVVLDCCPKLSGTITGDSICTGGTKGSLTFTTIDSTEPYTLRYTNGTDTFTSVNVKNNIPFIISPQPNVTTKYILLSIKDTTTCDPTIVTGDTATITVNPLPKGYLTGDDICAGDGGILLFTSTSGSPLFSISYSANGNAYTQTGVDNNSTFTVPFQLNNSTNFTLTSITDANGCIGTLDTSATINVLQLPQGGLTDATACTGDSAGITFNSSMGTGPFEVEISDGTRSTVYYDVQSGIAFNIAPVTQTTTISLISITDRDGDGCTRTSGFTSPTATITAKPSPEIEFDQLTAMCIQQSPFLITQARETTGASGNGIFSGDGVDGNGNFDPSAAGIGTHKITYAYNGSNGCSAIDSSSITVNPTPVVSAGLDVITCLGFTVQLNATGGSTYQWSPITGLDNPSIKNPVANIDSTTTYIVLGTDSNGCYASDTVKITVGASGVAVFAVPNAFTPNNDGVNDCFGIRRWGGVSVVEFDIFNRWGELIFTTKNPSDCWDGTFKGKLQPTGGYPYIIKAKTPCGDVTRKGIVILAR